MAVPYVILAVSFGLATAIIGRGKGSSFFIWLLVGTALPGLGLIGVILYRPETEEPERRCPRCGKGKLYAGFIDLRPNCEVCGLDYAFIDAGDGPAIFIIMLAGAVVVTAALIVEIKYQPPFWLHAALWLPLIIVTTLLPLRSMKSLLIALQFHHKAAPGRLIDREPK